MKKLSARGWAIIGICVQFLALIRSLSEIWRLHYAEGAGFRLENALDFVNGGLIAAGMCFLGLIFFFYGRFRVTSAIAVLTVIGLMVYKLAYMGVNV